MPWPWRHDSLEKRIARFVNDAAKWIESAWPKADGPAGYAGQQQHLQAVFRKLESGWPPDELPALAADVFFHPTLWFESEPTCSGRIQHLLWVYLASNPPKDIVSRIEGRMRHLLEHPCDAEIPSRQRMQRMYTSSPMHFYIPDMRSCLQLLAHLQPTPQVLELIHRIVLGRFNEQPVSAPCFIRSKELWGSFIVCAGSPNRA